MVASALLGSSSALLGQKVVVHRQARNHSRQTAVKTRAATQYAEELVKTAVSGEFCLWLLHHPFRLLGASC